MKKLINAILVIAFCFSCVPAYAYADYDYDFHATLEANTDTTIRVTSRTVSEKLSPTSLKAKF